jgi:hypothetical protein
MANEEGIIKKGLKDIKRKLRSRSYDYFNKYLSIDLLLSMYQNHRILDDKLIFNFDEINNDTFYTKFLEKGELTESALKTQIIFKEEINAIFFNAFQSINNQLKTSSLFEARSEEDDDKEITNLEREGIRFTPNRELELSNIHTLMNKYEEFSFRLNPLISMKEDKDFNFNRINTVKKFKINIKGKVFQEDNIDKLVSEFLYICPRCFGKIYLLPNQTYTGIKHACPDFVGENGKQMYTQIKNEARMASNSKQIWLYEFTISGEKIKRYAYSFDSTITPGRYVADILLTVDSLTGDTKKNLALILGVEKEKIKIIDDLVTNKDSVKWCKSKDLPHARFLDALFSIRKMYKDYTVHNINDKGMLNQIFITISGLAKLFFKYRCFGVNVIGSTSLSKSYTGELFSLALDRDYLFIQNGTDVTVPGLKGGVNNQKEINGEKTTIFEEGAFTRGGLTIFDEGQNFFTNNELNASLKDLFNTSINIQKVGGKDGIKQNYTPIIYSNKSIHQDEYSNYVKSVYSLIIRPVEASVPHLKTENEVSRYINSVDLFMPISYYLTNENNEFLAKAIYYVREVFRNKDVEWRTGGSVPANFRLLFDVLCFTKEETFEKCGKRVAERNETILPEVYDIPFEEMQAALINYYDNINIDLYKINNNNSKIISQINKLFDDINNFLINDGVDIHIHLSNNCKKMDEKLSNLVSTFIAILQLLEDKNSEKLSDNIKEWSKLILLKCKRGIKEEEYNFQKHYNYDFKRFDMSELMGDIKAIKQDKQMTEMVKKALTNDSQGIMIDLEGLPNEINE